MGYRAIWLAPNHSVLYSTGFEQNVNGSITQETQLHEIFLRILPKPFFLWKGNKNFSS